MDKQQLKSEIVKMVKAGCGPNLKFWTLKTIDQWSNSPRQKIKGTAIEKRDAIHELVDEGVLYREEIDLAIIGKKGMNMQILVDDNKAKENKYIE